MFDIVKSVQIGRFHRSHQKSTDSLSSFNARFEAYNRLEAATVAFGEKLPILEIVAIRGQSDGKSSLLEALLGFRFNVREVKMGTRTPVTRQMVHDPTALDPRCRFKLMLILLVRQSLLITRDVGMVPESSKIF